MTRLHRWLLLASAALVLVPRSNIAAQLLESGIITGAVSMAPVDASALGVTRGSSMGLFVGQEAYGAGVGMDVAGGALRGFLGGAANHQFVGAGFARTLVKRPVIGGLYALLGGQLVGGYRHTTYSPHDAGALNLTTPLGISFGEPDAYSFTVYGTPYAELGMMRLRRVSCPPFGGCNFSTGQATLMHAIGVGVGTRLSFHRASIDLAVPNGGALTLGVNYRFGR